MTSHASQPSSSISARDIGRNGAVPNRCAQCLRYENSGFGVSVCIGDRYDDGARSQWALALHGALKLSFNPD
jgi:hypothetical protein